MNTDKQLQLREELDQILADYDCASEYHDKHIEAIQNEAKSAILSLIERESESKWIDPKVRNPEKTGAGLVLLGRGFTLAYYNVNTKEWYIQDEPVTPHLWLEIPHLPSLPTQ